MWANYQQDCFHLLVTGNTKTPPTFPQEQLLGNSTIRRVFQQFRPKNLLILLQTFLILPSASTSGCENFSLKVFTPANLEVSRAVAAILKSPIYASPQSSLTGPRDVE